ncbi:MAG: hypothetical protein HZB15_05370 [Actinobacteria bacterium]|nr:hypothetical protein [Actinomycetota bacterium]
MTTSVVPALWNTEKAPSSDSFAVIWLATASAPAVQLRLDAVGMGSMAGNTVTNPSAVGRTAVMLAMTAVAVAGIMHAPWSPRAANVTVSPGRNGTVRAPMPSRVSTKRHGTMVTADEATLSLEPAAEAPSTAPPVSVTVTAAPMAAHRLRASVLRSRVAPSLDVLMICRSL